MKHLTLAFALLASLILTSCVGGDEPENTWKYTYTDNFSRISNLQSEAVYNAKGATYIISCDLNTGICDLSVSGLELQPGKSPINLSLKDLKFAYNKKGGLEVNASAVTSDIAGTTHEITNLALLHYRIYMPQINNSAIASTYTISFVVDGIYQVRVVQKSVVQPGSTTVTNLANDAIEELTLPYYSYDLNNETMKAVFRAHNIRYGSQLPINITVTDVPFTVGPSGVEMLLDGPVSVNVNNSPDPNTIVSNLVVRPDFSCRTILSFIVNGQFRISATLGPDSSK